MKRCWLLAILGCSPALLLPLGAAPLYGQSQSSAAVTRVSGPRQYPIRSSGRDTLGRRPVRQALVVETPAVNPIKNDPAFGTGASQPRNDPDFGTGPQQPVNDPDFGTGPIKQTAGAEETTRSGGYNTYIGRAYWQETTTNPDTGEIRQRAATENPRLQRHYEYQRAYNPATGVVSLGTVRRDRISGRETQLRATQNLITGERSRTEETIVPTPWGTRRTVRTHTIDPVTGYRRVDRGQSFGPPGSVPESPALDNRLYYHPFTGMYRPGSPANPAWPGPPFAAPLAPATLPGVNVSRGLR